jgi:hypothetical protein
VRYRKPPDPVIPDFAAFAKSLTDTAHTVAKTEIRKFANDERQAFVQAIHAQQFAAFAMLPLSDRTIAKKLRYGAPMETMIATGEYLRSIKVFDGIMPQKGHVEVKPWKTAKDVVMQLTIGIDQFQRARDLATKRYRRVLMQDVARIQEFGASAANIPPRPHWGPHYQNMVKRAGKLRAEIARLVCDTVGSKMGRKR